VRVPPLRDRIEDVPEIVEFMLQKLEKNRKLRVRRVAPEAMAVLCRHTWPGIVRELENVIYRSAVVAQGDTILVKDFPPELQAADEGASRAASALSSGAAPDESGPESSPMPPPSPPIAEDIAGLYDRLFSSFQAAGSSGVLKLTEREMIARALTHFAGDQAKAAEFLGLSRTMLKKRADELGV
jgi:two-component system nitrogen regulation response regulator GlnG